jgi:hypothetical protein
MFSNDKAGEKLAAALAEYQKDFEKRLQTAPNPDSKEAKDRIERAEALVAQSGLGRALTTLLSHVKYWPTWSEREDFRKYVGFPVDEVLAKEERKQEKYDSTTIMAVLFVYKGARYGMVFKHGSGSTMPDGSYFQGGTLEFLSNGEVMLGLDVSLPDHEFSDWTYFGVNALKMGPWSKALLEIAAHIHAHVQQSRAKSDDDYTINKAKNISI